MTGEPLYLSLKDTLRAHRTWITELYVNTNKSDVEITVALQAQGIKVSPKQLQECLQEWGIFADPILRIGRVAMEDNYTLDPSSQPQLGSPMQRTTPDVPVQPAVSPHLPAQYECDQLSGATQLDLPSQSSSSTSPMNLPKHEMTNSSRDLLKLTCHHGPNDSHEVYSTLDFLPDGPSQIEVFANEEQNQETPFIRGGFPYKRAQDVSRNAKRSLRMDVRMKKRDKTPRLRNRDALNNEKRADSRHGGDSSSHSCTINRNGTANGRGKMGEKGDEEEMSPK